MSSIKIKKRKERKREGKKLYAKKKRVKTFKIFFNLCVKF